MNKTFDAKNSLLFAYCLYLLICCASATAEVTALKSVIITSLPDTFTFKPGRTQLTILGLDTAIHIEARFTAMCNGPGYQDLNLQKLPEESTQALVVSRHPCCSYVDPACGPSYQIHSEGIQYVLSGMGKTYYFKPFVVFVNKETALLDSVHVIVDSVSFFPRTSIFASRLILKPAARKAICRIPVDAFGRRGNGHAKSSRVVFYGKGLNQRRNIRFGKF